MQRIQIARKKRIQIASTEQLTAVKYFICPTNYYKIVKSFKIIIVAPTCFGLHKNQHQGALSLCFPKVTMSTSVTYRYLKLSVLWLHMKPHYR